MVPLNVSSEVDAYMAGFLGEVGISSANWLPSLPMASNRAEALLAMQKLKEVKRVIAAKKKAEEQRKADEELARKKALAEQQRALLMAQI
jgi:hypothetical protein